MTLIDEIQYIKINEKEFLIVNLINAATDSITDTLYEQLINKQFSDIDDNALYLLKERNYLFENVNEKNEFYKILDRKINKSEQNTIPNFLMIPTFACNLNCKYCYEQTYEINNVKPEDELQIVDKQIAFIKETLKNNINESNKAFNNNDVKITLMGGEPLLSSKKDLLTYIFKEVKSCGFGINIITNGYDLEHFIDEIKKYQVEFIQITLDGPPSIHNKRRIKHNGEGSFNKIINNIKLAIDHHIKVVIRVNVDNENLQELPELAEIITNQIGMNKFVYPYLYLMQDGGCSGDANVLKEEVGIDLLNEVTQRHPIMNIFNTRFHGTKFINSIFEDKPFSPCLRHCSAESNQYILDCKGYIYKCWHGIGNELYSVGNYLNGIDINTEKCNKWKNRNVLKIEKCTTCIYRYICGTGCPASQHDSFNSDSVNKEMCVDYEVIIERIIKQKVLVNKDLINA